MSRGRAVPPPPQVSPAEAASVKDRVYFQRHPGETVYHRPYVPGEFGPAFELPDLPGVLMVEVEQIGPFMRRRRPAFVAIEVPQ